jgi:hypothetical protein
VVSAVNAFGGEQEGSACEVVTFSKYSLRDTEQREHLKQEVCQCLLSRAVTYVPCVMMPLQSMHTSPTICALCCVR